MKTKIAVLVSGGGTNLQALIDSQTRGELCSGEIALVVSNSRKAFALERAKKVGIPTRVLLKKELGGQEGFEKALLETLEEYKIQVIILAGFMSILSGNFTDRYPRRVHEAALQKVVKVTGATVHFVNQIPDGGEIVAQKAVEILPGDTPEVLQRRVMEQAEWLLLPRAAEQVCAAIQNEKGE